MVAVRQKPTSFVYPVLSPSTPYLNLTNLVVYNFAIVSNITSLEKNTLKSKKLQTNTITNKKKVRKK